MHAACTLSSACKHAPHLLLGTPRPALCSLSVVPATRLTWPHSAGCWEVPRAHHAGAPQAHWLQRKGCGGIKAGRSARACEASSMCWAASRLSIPLRTRTAQQHTSMHAEQRMQTRTAPAVRDAKTCAVQPECVPAEAAQCRVLGGASCSLRRGTTGALAATQRVWRDKSRAISKGM